MQNELENAADAGALAGASDLINPDGSVNAGSNLTGQAASMENLSDKSAVEVVYNAGNDNVGDVQRGHWSFSNQVFTPSAYTGTYDPPWPPAPQMDIFDPNKPFINAVSVVTRRETTPATSFFARIFGYQSFDMNAEESVAYLGSPGGLGPGELDAPIAICHEALYFNDTFQCVTGRMLNDGGSPGSHETAMWVDYEQEANCPSASASTISGLLNNGSCAGLDMGNPGNMIFGLPMDSTNGVQDASFDDFMDLWENCATYDHDGDPTTAEVSIDTDSDGMPDRGWKLALPVVMCDQGPCSALVGTVTIELVWIIEKNLGGANAYDETPVEMTANNTSWTCSLGTDRDAMTPAQRQQCWDEFAPTFNLKNLDNTPAPYDSKSIYFLPSCEPQVPRGTTGGENFGVLARIPVLVH